MTEKEITKQLQKTLYFKKFEQSEEFLLRFNTYLFKHVEKHKKMPNILQIARLMTKIISDIKEKDTDKIKHKILKENRHLCFQYFFEEIVELIELDWKAYKIQKYFENKKKCKAPARNTIAKFIKSYHEENLSNGKS